MTDTFLGVPITGTIHRGEHKAIQRPLEELAPLMQAVLDDKGIDSFGWYQYTPYFNDGEPCIFNVYSLWALPTEHADDPEDDRYYSLSEKWGDGIAWNENWTSRKEAHPDQYARVVALAEAIESEEFDDVLLGAFGDHAEVTVRRSGITVEEYSHD